MAAVSGARTCHKGHPRTPENTYVRPKTGAAECRVCHSATTHRWRNANLEKAREQERASRARNPERKRETDRASILKNLYRLTPEDFDHLVQRQGGGCAICGSDRRLEVDHDHACCDSRTTCGSCVRGVLCRSCNHALGVRNDNPVGAKRGPFTDPELAERAAVYVASFRPTLIGVS